MKSVLFTFAVLFAASAAQATITCNVLQNGKVIQTESANDFSGPISGEPKALFAFNTEADGTSSLCVLSEVSPTAIAVCAKGQTQMSLDFYGKFLKTIQCAVQ